MTIPSRFLLSPAVILFLMACTPVFSQPTPVLIAPADTPIISTRAPIPSAVTEPAVLPVSGEPAAGEAPVSTPALPTATLPPLSAGLRPDQAQQFRPPESWLEEAPEDWRPPPMPVPLSLDPNDHYWLIRPIASGRRNYDLEWYPYGNDVLLPELRPYRVHHGMDFPNDTGTPILAAASGRVIHAGSLPSNRDGVNYYGNTVIIHHDWQWLGKDVYTLYAHTLELFVAVGDYVQQGQLIAGVGASGEVSGPHLHLEVRVGQNNYHSTRNPALWLAPYEGWGTLAGRFVDNRGRMIQGALVSVYQGNASRPMRVRRTYVSNTVVSDELWNENFVVSDLPAGRYTVLLAVAGQTFRRTIDVQPGRTNFFVIQADFAYFPTATPTATATATPTTAATPDETGEP